MCFNLFFKLFSTTTELIKRQYQCLKLMCGNTRPKLLEVSYRKTSQHSKGLYSYGVNYRTLLTDIPPWHYTETDEDGAR